MRFTTTVISLFVVALSVGCSKLNLPSATEPTALSVPEQTAMENSAPSTLVVQDQRDPFALSSIKEAMAAIVTEKTGLAKQASDIIIQPNFLYVKFTTFTVREAGKLQN